jgi:hypothetical protein
MTNIDANLVVDDVTDCPIDQVLVYDDATLLNQHASTSTMVTWTSSPFSMTLLKPAPDEYSFYLNAITTGSVSVST